jgi:hypothetical protein
MDSGSDNSSSISLADDDLDVSFRRPVIGGQAYDWSNATFGSSRETSALLHHTPFGGEDGLFEDDETEVLSNVTEAGDYPGLQGMTEFESGYMFNDEMESFMSEVVRRAAVSVVRLQSGCAVELPPFDENPLLSLTHNQEEGADPCSAATPPLDENPLLSLTDNQEEGADPRSTATPPFGENPLLSLTDNQEEGADPRSAATPPLDENPLLSLTDNQEEGADPRSTANTTAADKEEEGAEGTIL